MYAKTNIRISSEIIRADIITTYAPATFPVTSDNVSNLPKGLRLAPYSSIYIASQSKLYMLGTDSKWYPVTMFGGSGGGVDFDTATDEEINDIIGGFE